MPVEDDVPIEVDCAQVKSYLDTGTEFHFVDCREQDEHDLVHLPEATLIPMSELTGRVDELEAYRDQKVVIHCHHGGRSLRVAQWLREQGFAKAQSMAGGIDAWAVEIDSSLPRYG